MDANATSSPQQSEPDQDNSSLQNPSTNPAEAGTTDETRDEEHETSSIEALNWSEVEEEELAAAQQAEALAAVAAAAAQGKPANKVKENEEDSSATNNDSSTVSSTVHLNDEGNVLSTSLLQSINSSASDADSQARKLSVIENWASEVSDAVERGEIVMTEEFPDENGTTGDDECEAEEEVCKEGMRKRRGRRVSPDMVSSITSSASNAESSIDPLSNAPVLDDGPIWNKGPRSYTFQENRRINQKLTFCLLIAVVLALGLGLGNLVAHQECEAEFKASQQSQVKSPEITPIHAGVPTTTTPAPIIPERSTDSSMMGSSLPNKKLQQTVNPHEKDDEIVKRYAKPDEPPVVERIKRDDPVIDPKYRAHAETVSSVVHTIDRLSRKIDKFENNTRTIQGVLVIPDEEKETSSEDASSSLYDEQVHVDPNDDNDLTTEEEDKENELAIAEDLIDAIEQTPNYLEKKRLDKRIAELDKMEEERLSRSSLFKKTPITSEKERHIEIVMKSVRQFKDFEHRFVKSERKRLIDEGKFSRHLWREPEDYTDEEKFALRARHKSAWQEFLKLIADKNPDPIEALFGTEEELEERTYGDVFHYPWPDPEDGLSDEEHQEQFRKNLAELREFEKSNAGGFPDETEKEDGTPEVPVIEIEAESPEPSAQHSEPNDDLIILEHKTPVETVAPPVHRPEAQDQAHVRPAGNDDLGKSTSSTDEAAKVVAGDPSSTENSQPATSPSFINSSDESDSNSVEKSKMTGEVPTSSPSPPVKKTKRDTSAKHSTSKSKKSGNKPTNDATNNNNSRQKPQSGNRGEQKQKEQKAKKQKGKGSNLDSNESGSVAAAGNKAKVSGKGKKQKNLESNKVSENIKGKNTEKRRNTAGAEGRGKEAQFADNKAAEMNNRGRRGKKAPKESTNGSTKQGNNNNNRNSGPKYHDPRDIKEQQESGDNRGKDRRGGSQENKSGFRPKSENQDFSKETQYRQQEFSSNYENRNQNSGTQGKKGKTYQSKEKADWGKERKWGN